MKCKLRLSLPVKFIPDSRSLDSAGSEHKDELAALMLDAYKGTADYEGESLEEAKEEISNLLEGKYGIFLIDHSLLYRENGVLVSATLVTLEQGTPLLAYSMTRSGYKRRGHAGALIVASADSLERAGYTHLDLWVTDCNHPAINLYKKLGFVKV